MNIDIAKQIISTAKDSPNTPQGLVPALGVSLDLLNNTFSAEFQALQTAQKEANDFAVEKNRAVVEKNEAITFKDSEIARIISETDKIVEDKNLLIDDQSGQIEVLTVQKEELITDLTSKQEELDLLTENYNSINNKVTEVLNNPNLDAEQIRQQLSSQIEEVLPVEEVITP